MPQQWDRRRRVEDRFQRCHPQCNGPPPAGPADLLRVFYEPFWRMRPEDEEGDRPDRVFPMPVFARAADGGFTSQYSRTYINQAQEVPGVPPLTEAQNAAMDLLHEIGEEICLFAPFEPGDIQFMTQHVTYHGRTAFRNDPRAGASRAEGVSDGIIHNGNERDADGVRILSRVHDHLFQRC